MGDAQLRLIIMRHAKAGELPGGPDADRPLTPRGHRDAVRAGRWLLAGGLVPDAVVCSPARRTRQTWDEVAAQLGREVPATFDPDLYGADAPGLREVIGQTPPGVAVLLCVGHNPAMAELAEDLAGQPLEFPTSAIAVIGLPGPWDEVTSAAAGDLAAFWTPRRGDGLPGR
jgi:phosphohistidine phosphatase